MHLFGVHPVTSTRSFFDSTVLDSGKLQPESMMTTIAKNSEDRSIVCDQDFVATTFLMIKMPMTFSSSFWDSKAFISTQLKGF